LMVESSQETPQKTWIIPNTQTIQCDRLAAAGHEGLESQALRRYSVSNPDIKTEEKVAGKSGRRSVAVIART
jgi:hypothetical protein